MAEKRTIEPGASRLFQQEIEYYNKQHLEPKAKPKKEKKEASKTITVSVNCTYPGCRTMVGFKVLRGQEDSVQVDLVRCSKHQDK